MEEFSCSIPRTVILPTDTTAYFHRVADLIAKLSGHIVLKSAMSEHSIRRSAMAGLIAAPFFFVLVLVFGAMEPGYSHVSSAISILGGAPGVRGLAFNVGVIATGFLLVAFAFGLSQRLTRGVATRVGTGMLVIGGLGLAGSGYFHCSEGCRNIFAAPDVVGWLHGLSSLAAGIGTGLAPLFIWGAMRRSAQWKDLAIPTLFAGILANMLGIAFWFANLTGSGPTAAEGLFERFALLFAFIWVFAAAARLRTLA